MSVCVAVKSQEYERAASLAEKYCEFSTLIEICEELNNEERLWRYMDQFRDNVSTVVTYVEDLKMSGNLTATRELSGN